MDEYIYGVARIRALESTLLTDEDVNALVEAKDYDSALQILKDKGWGSNDSNETLSDIIKIEQDKTREVLDEIIDDERDKEILIVEDEYHNLKTAIKKVVTDAQVASKYVYVALNPKEVNDENDNHIKVIGNITILELEDIIRNSEYDKLPHPMIEPARDAAETLIKSGDGQLCDVIIDKALLKRLVKIGQASDNSLIRDYADIKVGMANIKIAIRAALAGKDADFVFKATFPCNYVNVNELEKAAEEGIDSVIDYLKEIGHTDLAEAAKKSKSYFECVCDNKIIERIKSQKYETFTIGPILAYALARYNELKTVRIILKGKENGFDENFIKERARMMYA